MISLRVNSAKRRFDGDPEVPLLWYLRDQLEGSAVVGTSIARTGEITAAEVRIQQSNFHNYTIARMNTSRSSPMFISFRGT
jgi:hypothetical protein